MSYQLALGPFGTVWRGPLRIVLHVSDDQITEIEQRDGYHSRGCAARLARLDLRETLPLVSRVCGLHAQHHALAWTLALEQLAGLTVPPRAQTLRLLVAEGERAASHLASAALVLGLVGLEPAQDRLVRVRELILQGVQTITGQRFSHEFVLPGGVQYDMQQADLQRLSSLLTTSEQQLRTILEQLLRQRGLHQRLTGLGRVTAEHAMALGLTGVMARASGVETDLRRDQPYAGYATLLPHPINQRGGDVQARLFMLLLEGYESLGLQQRLLAQLPDGLWRGDALAQVPAGSASVTVEAPSGPLRYSLNSDGVRLNMVEIAGPALPQRLLLRALLVGQAAEDAELIIASLAPCTACAEP